MPPKVFVFLTSDGDLSKETLKVCESHSICVCSFVDILIYFTYLWTKDIDTEFGTVEWFVRNRFTKVCVHFFLNILEKNSDTKRLSFSACYSSSRQHGSQDLPSEFIAQLILTFPNLKNNSPFTFPFRYQKAVQLERAHSVDRSEGVFWNAEKTKKKKKMSKINTAFILQNTKQTNKQTHTHTHTHSLGLPDVHLQQHWRRDMLHMRPRSRCTTKRWEDSCVVSATHIAWRFGHCRRGARQGWCRVGWCGLWLVQNKILTKKQKTKKTPTITATKQHRASLTALLQNGRWTCKTCTLENDVASNACEACGAPNPKPIVKDKKKQEGTTSHFFLERK